MAVVVDAIGPGAVGAKGSGVTSLVWDHVCTGSNTLLTVGVGMGGADGSVTTTVTYNGVTMTSAGKVHANNQTQGYVELFYLVGPSAGLNSVAVTCSASRVLTGGSVSFTGVDQTNPIANSTTNFGSGTLASLTVSSASGNMVTSVIATGTSVTSSTDTMQWLANFSASSGAGNSAQATDSGASSVPMSFAVGDDWWGMIGMDIAAAPTTPLVTTEPVSNISDSTATGNGTVVSDGISTILERGICWSASPNPTTSDSKIPVAGTLGSFSASMTGLSNGTLYHVRAYAINSMGTSYGSDVTFINYPVSLSWIAA